MTRKPASAIERLKAWPLWQWGLLVIFAGLVGSVLQAQLAPAANPAAERAAALGRGVAALLFIIIGIVLIGMHFVRRGR